MTRRKNKNKNKNKNKILLYSIIGLLLIIPITRKVFFKSISKKYSNKKNKENFIEGEYEDMDDKK